MYKMIIFDLDGTLALSKCAITKTTANLLHLLLKRYKVAIITGGDFQRFEKQIFPMIEKDEDLMTNLYICPTCSTKMYIFKDGVWTKLYSEDLTSDEKNKILDNFNFAIKEVGFKPEKTWGEIIEDRGTQITFSALGQEAPLSEKEKWDPDFKKRIAIKKILDKNLKGFFIRFGGLTSIDITREGVDKGYGIKKLRDLTKIELNEMLFVGDAIFPGGNDYPAYEIGVSCKKTSGPTETEKIIEELINERK